MTHRSTDHADVGWLATKGVPEGGHAPVVVVGAGLAGLSCAARLVALGRSVQLLETGTRVGGMVHTLDNWGPHAAVDAGGDFVSPAHTALLGMLRHFGIGIVRAEYHEALPVCRIRGAVLSKAEQDAILAEVERARARMNQDALLPRAEDRSLADVLASVALSTHASSWLRAEWESLNGVALEQQSYNAVLDVLFAGGLERFWNETASFSVDGGAERLVSALAHSLPANALHLGARVAEVRRSGDTWHVRTETGQSFRANEVVIATSPAAWSDLSISPQIPWTCPTQVGDVAKYLARVRGPLAKTTVRGFTDGPLGFVWTCSRNKEEAILVPFSGGPAARACASARFLRVAVRAAVPELQEKLRRRATVYLVQGAAGPGWLTPFLLPVNGRATLSSGRTASRGFTLLGISRTKALSASWKGRYAVELLPRCRFSVLDCLAVTGCTRCIFYCRGYDRYKDASASAERLAARD